MSTGPLVTVIVPVYNGERYLASALESVRGQRYTPWEGIVVDDGSTDATPAIARGFAEFQYLAQQNRGPAAARNAGLEIARGEFVAFLDSDDTMTRAKLEVQVRHLVDHPEIGYVLGRQTIVLDGVEAPSWLVRDPIYGDLDGIPSASAVFRKAVLQGAGGFDETLHYGEFADLFVRLRVEGVERAIVDEIVLERRLHGGNINFVARPTQHPFFGPLRRKLATGRNEHPKGPA